MPDNPIQAWQAKEDNPNSKDPKGSSKSSFGFTFGALIAMLGVSFCMLKGISSVLLGIGLIFLGAFLILRGQYWRTQISLCKKYVALLNAAPSTSIADFAASLGISPTEALENAETLVNAGMLEGVVIDKHAKRFVSGISTQSDAEEPALSKQFSTEQVEVECQGCGARKSIRVGTKSTCDYCGADLHAW